MSNEFIRWLQAALSNPVAKAKLLQQPQKLQQIMSDIPARQWIFTQACQTDDPKLATQAKNLIIEMMKCSRLIWSGGGNLSPDIYEEALSRTWEWFNKEMCLAYVPEKGSFVTWFNQRLKFRILDVIREQDKEQKRRLHLSTDEEDDEWIYPPAPEPERWHETIQEWLELVKNHAHLRNCRMQHRPDINCQFLLIHILQKLHSSGEFSWNALAQSYQVEAATLKRFCKMRCFPIFKQLLSK
ncbi:hypothetical protein [Nostoc sp. MS1]|uniref:hypothetical protein n=1 Tax=Nostoc sp. MS1 TaxID=2764711 RepID=UPI001CC424FD|nr:hypothetical protein [Nostoc sp. MS1]BCL35250.1 hypothetical protein NSMS1_16970 [Nostoc sp. MS1]